MVLFTRGEWDRSAAVCEDVLASPAQPHARGAAAGMLGLVYAMRGAARQARPHLLESHLIATRIELVPMADEPRTALRELRSAAEKFAELELPYATAQSQLRAAAAAAQTGDQAAALDLLYQVHDTAGRLGAHFLLTACAAALSELGARPRGRTAGRGARRPRTAAGLTVRELEIMLLVAQGNTSRQIGETLFISPRTVEMHVQGSLLKLGCRTRAEAIGRLAELGTLPAEATTR